MSLHFQNLLGEPSRDGFLATVARLAAVADDAALHVGNREAERLRRCGRPMNMAYDCVTDGGTPVDEELCVPPTDGLVLKAPERALVAKGWRFVAVPRHTRRDPAGYDALRSPLNWETRTWLAVPPADNELAARSISRNTPPSTPTNQARHGCQYGTPDAPLARAVVRTTKASPTRHSSRPGRAGRMCVRLLVMTSSHDAVTKQWRLNDGLAGRSLGTLI